MSQQQKKRPQEQGGPKVVKKQKQDEKAAPKPQQQQQKKPQQQQQKKPQQQQQQKKPQPKEQKKAPKQEKEEEEAEILGDEGLDGLTPEIAEQLNDIEDGLQAITNKIIRQVRKVELSHDKDRRALFAKRDEIVKNVPEFWLKVFLGLPELRDMLTPADLEIAGHIASLNVENLPTHKDGSDGGYKIVFNFKPNPIIESKVIQKEYRMEVQKEDASPEDDSHITVSTSDVKFKSNKFVQENKDSFLIQWFTDAEKESDVQLGQIFRDELYPQAFNVFMSTFEDDDEDADLDDDDLIGNLAGLEEEEDGEGEGEGAEGGDE